MRDLNDFEDGWFRLVDRYYENGIESLDQNERIWFCCQSLIQAIYDGGLISYYFNSGADNIVECMSALKSLEQDRLVELLRLVNSRLFPEGVPRSIEARNSVISSIPDDGELDEYLDPIEGEAKSCASALENRLAAFIEARHVAS